MSITKSVAVCTFAVTCLVTLPTLAKQPTFVASQAVGERSVRSMVGISVKNNKGEVIGDINNVVLDPRGVAKTVVIGVGGFLGLNEKEVGVPYTSIEFKSTKEKGLVAKLNVTKAQLKSASSYQWKEKNWVDKAKDTVKQTGKAAGKAIQQLKEGTVKK